LGTKKDEESRNFKKTVLPNGLRLVTERMPHVRSVSMGIWVAAGSRDEQPAQSGISHFIEHMVFKGTKRRDAKQIALEIDSIGGASNAFTSKEATCFHARVLDEHTPVMVDLLADIFLDSVYDPKEIERERQVILQEIGLAQDTPDEYVHDLLSETIWGGHALGRPILGEVQTVRGMVRPHILDYLSMTYGPQNVIVSAAGHLEHKEMLSLVSERFSGMSPNGDTSPRTAPVAMRSVKSVTRDLEQVHLCLGVRGLSATSGERFAAAILNIILGGSMSSRLFQIIREQKGLAYSIYSFLSSYVDTGMLGVYVGVERKDVAKALRLITRELKRMKRDPVTEAELTAAKENIKGGLYLSAESTDNRMSRLAKNELNFGRFIPYSEIVENMERVTVEDVKALAQKLFRDKHLALAVIGPMEEGEVPGELLKLS